MHFEKAPDGRRWPLIERNRLSAADIEVLRAQFAAAFDVGIEKDTAGNAVSFGHMIRQDRCDIAGTAISTVLASPAGETARALLGDDLAFLVDNCSFRFHETDNTRSHLGFHLDADFVGVRSLALNLWVPLTSVGETAPGLTFLTPEIDARPLLDRWWDFVASKPNPSSAPLRIRFDPENIRNAVSGPEDSHLLSPVLDPGDALVFHQFVMHATQKMDGPHPTRRSMEFRVCAADAIPTFYANRGLPIFRWRCSQGTWRPVD